MQLLFSITKEVQTPNFLTSEADYKLLPAVTAVLDTELEQYAAEIARCEPRLLARQTSSEFVRRAVFAPLTLHFVPACASQAYAERVFCVLCVQ